MTKILVDWGSSNCRAYLLNESGHLQGNIHAELGVLRLEQGAFEAKLRELLSPWGAILADCDIWLAGMVGSRRGWYEVAYVPSPARSDQLATHSKSLDVNWARSVRIIPGVSCSGSDNFDVMRGEEVQLIGLMQILAKPNAYAMLPGTHNKHVEINDGAIGRFSTHPTGELYAVVTQHMLLGYGLNSSTAGKYPQAFCRGLDKGAQSSKLGNSLFGAWTNRLGGRLTDEETLDYISGVLIGNELRDFPVSTCAIVCDDVIGERYLTACEHLGIGATLHSGAECFLTGMKAISES
ncbi:2-dehydro-3-deoxygalactonokinase [Gilvimarinus agarilyticus]|uniref:2-dehydro-3-deoxygalactonokinase n=1 Tax=Gilvimarinus sp. 2_MG-2023 TaxID=3062666 RepID=UPI001C09C838|nr:2-dehydro-3-deoxygalactonokinase [Gilvimarinus sp. 2_MG-2023]MBU2886385.1 2-dehydro-3-deoxygalactonokinase [Gilvimarinus agarilyticus]MDO6571064.1 2-dehydro-3-deoxygalactonokinase [Gilvimarinus sp. 2_MG-2023]